MTHMSPVATMRSSLPPVSLTAPAFTALLGDRSRLRAAQLDKRTAIARLETAWVAAAEADAASGRGGSVRMDDRETWDRGSGSNGTETAFQPTGWRCRVVPDAAAIEFSRVLPEPPRS